MVEGDATGGGNAINRVSTYSQTVSQLVEAANLCAAMIRTLKAQDLGRHIETHFGIFPLAFLAVMPMTDTIHHHGQIAYIQTLPGDTESHFDMSLLQQSTLSENLFGKSDMSANEFADILTT